MLLRYKLLQGWVKPFHSVDVQQSDYHNFTPYQDPDRSKQYYITMTIWYVLKTCPEALPSEEKSKTAFYQLLSRRMSHIVNRAPADNADMGTATGLKASLLRWYHHESTYRIWQVLKQQNLVRDDTNKDKWKHDANKGLVETRGQEAGESKESDEWLSAGCQKEMMTKIRAQQPYTAMDEPCDRLAFLPIEFLPFEALGELGQLGTDPSQPTSLRFSFETEDERPELDVCLQPRSVTCRNQRFATPRAITAVGDKLSVSPCTHAGLARRRTCGGSSGIERTASSS